MLPWEFDGDGVYDLIYKADLEDFKDGDGWFCVEIDLQFFIKSHDEAGPLEVLLRASGYFVSVD